MSNLVACWSCKGPIATPRPAFCPTCKAIQPPDLQLSYFELFDQPKGFYLDLQSVEERYRTLQQAFHPDRYATRSPTEGRFSMEQVTRLNEGLQTLRDPLSRAGYLLQLEGRSPGDESSGAAPSDPAFLMEVMELREELESVDLDKENASEQLDQLRENAALRIHDEVQGIGDAFEEWYEENAVGALDSVALFMDRLRYHRRYLEEIDQMEERLFDRE
ncbi:MAG: Fe-S protein assembly co-chaperone HscB [Magnetococcales bacterium]|nr:Fe-S protein assembly co-chaperone HscB [Magnetococcales bacterium]